MRRFARNVFQTPYRATIGADFDRGYLNVGELRMCVQGTLFTLSLSRTSRTRSSHNTVLVWDACAGPERFSSLSRIVYRGSHAICIVYDITRRETFNRVERWMDEVRVMMVSRPFITIGKRIRASSLALTQCSLLACSRFQEGPDSHETGPDARAGRAGQEA